MKEHQELQYLNLLENILENGTEKGDRTGTGTISLFGPQNMSFDLSEEFPSLTSKRLYFKGVVHELLWLISGDTNINYLKDNGVNIWNEWADENGDLGSVYGAQWRSWKKYVKMNISHITNIQEAYRLSQSVDQLKNVIDGLKNNPDSRRHIVSAWNVAEIDDMALPPCHAFFQFYSKPLPNGERELSCHLYQRSADMFLGVPFNIASYSLLTCMIAQVTNHKRGRFIHSFGDAHIYSNHIDQVKEQLSRKDNLYKLPRLELNSKIVNIDDFKFDDIILTDYKCHNSIKAPIAV